MPVIYYEEHYDGITIFETKEIELKKPSYLILGLPDAGLVGAISVSHLARTLNMEEYGGIESYRYFPPIVVVHKGSLYPPLRFFHKDNLVVLVPEIAIPTGAIYPLSYAITDYAQRKGFDFIISITGTPIPNRMEIDKPKVYWLATGKTATDVGKKLNIPIFEEGLLVGPYAVILKESMKRRMNNILLLVESYMEFPDPEAAATALEVLSKVTGVEVDVKKLLEEAEIIKLKSREMMRSTHRMLTRMGKGYEYQLPMLYT